MLRCSEPFLLMALAIFSTAASVAGDLAADRSECAQELVQDLSTCLQYVEGRARAPTPDCCAGLGKVRAEKPKCLCVLIKDHDSPELGVSINVTLAVGLPTVCHVPANVSHCPKLLNMPPDSKEAAIFRQPPATQGNGSSSSAPPDIQAHSSNPGNSNSVAPSGGKRVKRVGVYRLGVICMPSFLSLLPIWLAL